MVRAMKKPFLLLLSVSLLLPISALARIPATPVMTHYSFGGNPGVPYYSVESFERGGPRSPAGTLAQGSSVIPCLVIRDGRPLSDSSGTPYVGFELLVDARSAVREDSMRFKEAVAARESMTVENHHCPAGVKYVTDVRNLFPLSKAPFFDPPRPRHAPETKAAGKGLSRPDEIVRAFHSSEECGRAGLELMGRRGALSAAWRNFAARNAGRWPQGEIEKARHLDYAMRTAIYEGHLDRGCSAYGACERNVIALSIRNRGREGCSRGQGCSYRGDFEGVSSTVSQYNIWDEFLTQISGLASCFLRSDLQSPAAGDGAPDFNAEYYARIGRMYEQNVGDVEKILFGDEGDLASVFPGTPRGDLLSMRHYYHPPAMRKCFPAHPRVEYMSGATARKGDDFALVANTRIEVGEKTGGGYLFKSFEFEHTEDGDVVKLSDDFPGFAVDARKVSLKGSSGCVPYGIPGSCRMRGPGRYRTVPGWLRAGRPVAISCSVEERGESCRGAPRKAKAVVGERCDPEMVPVAGVR